MDQHAVSFVWGVSSASLQPRAVPWGVNLAPSTVHSHLVTQRKKSARIVATQRSVDFGSLAPGLNNRLEPTKLDTRLADRRKATYLYGAENVDLNGEGYLKRRRGQIERAGNPSHSLWGDLRSSYVVTDDVLGTLTLNGDTLSLTAVRSGMPKLPVSFSRGADGVVYWTNQQVIRRIANGADLPISAEPPSLVPTVTVTSGALAAGKYLVACTIEDANGESPATPVVQVEVPNNGGIVVDAASSVTVYMSGPNGDILTKQAVGDPVSIVVHTENGQRCDTLNTALLPAGTIVRHYNGRMLVASGNALYASNPYHYGIYDPSSGYFPFPADITVVEPTDNGLYICADKTYWIGDLYADKLQELLPYGGIRGSSGRSPDDEEVYWMSPRGLVVGDKNASVKNVQEAALEMAPAQSGASLYRERDGAHHIVSTRFGVEPSVASATSFMEAEVIRKGTVL